MTYCKTKVNCMPSGEQGEYVKDLYNLGLDNYATLTRVVNNKFKTNYTKYYIKKFLGITEPKWTRNNLKSDN